MGELHLAIRFTYPSSLPRMIHLYSQTLLQKLQYLHPLASFQVLKHLRFRAVEIVCLRFGRAWPCLRKEVIEYVLDVERKNINKTMNDFESSTWRMRKSRIGAYRIIL